MEPHSQVEDSGESRRILEGQLRECYGRVVYSHKTHEKCAEILLENLYWLKLSQITLSALTTAGFVGTIFGDGNAASIIGMALSIVLLCINSYTKDYDLGELAQKHKDTANSLWLIRERFLSLLVDLKMKERPLERLLEQRDMLTGDLMKIYELSPSTNSKAYKKAQVALQLNEDMTFSEQEIDAFLPKELKRTNE